MPQALAPAVDEIRRAVSVLAPGLGAGGDVTELRALNVPTGRGFTANFSGYYGNPAQLVEDAAAKSRTGGAVYVTLNPVLPGLLARSANRCQRQSQRGGTTSDHQISRRIWLPVDLDPKRPSGISATGDELDKALERAEVIREDLVEAGWPAPVEGMSGNGAHLLWRVDLPNDDDALALVNGCLKALAAKYGDDAVDVDTAVGNAARIWKLYGTVSRKGDHCPDLGREHRVSRLLRVPERVEVVGVDLLQALAAKVPQGERRETPRAAPPAASGDDWLGGWIAQRLPQARGPRAYNGGRAWDVKCPFCGRDDGRSIVGNLASGAIFYTCLHGSCDAVGWREFRERFDPQDQRRKPKEKKANGYEGKERKGKGEEESQSDVLVKLVQANASLFHDPDGVAYARSKGKVWRVRSGALESWARGLFYKTTKKAPSASAVADAVKVLEAIALHDEAAQEHEVYVRVAHVPGEAVYLDLGGRTSRAVEITAQGWRVVEEPPVQFLRPAGQRALPDPERGGSLDDLRELVNVPDDSMWALVKGWIVGAFGPGPYAILCVSGEQGSAKTSLCQLGKDVFDPTKAGLRQPPKGTQDLAIACGNAWVISYENLSHIPAWLSDALCSVATGSGFATRKLYSDSEEALFEFRRPILINGIEDLATRADLAERTTPVHLPPIEGKNRKLARHVAAEFKRAHPRILGGLLDLVSHGLATVPDLGGLQLPRMADAAEWVTSCTGDTTYLRAMLAAQAEGQEAAIEGDPVGAALIAFMTTRRDDEGLHGWFGPASHLLELLTEIRGDGSARDWPRTPRGLVGRLRRLAPGLRALGIEWQMGEHGRRRREHRLTWRGGE